ncbi:MAG: extracellular solute-binding protein [Lachnospiraceae bacterium]|nr:extracellular solute-binding protein [Lachnospiraceae bacterium]
MKKKIIAGFILLLILALAGCGRKKDNTSADEAARSKEYVYRMEDMDLSVNRYNSTSVIRSGDEFLTFEYDWPEDGGLYQIYFGRLTEDGTKEELFQLSGEEDGGYNNITSDGSNIYLINNKYYYTGEIDEETGEEISEGEYMDEYYLVKLTMSGDEVFSMLLNGVPELAKLEEEQGWFNAYGMFIVDEKLYISCNGIYACFDKEGNFQKLMGTPGEESEFNSANLIPLADGRVAAAVYEENGVAVALADMENGTIGEKTLLPGANGYSFYAGHGYDLYITDNTGMYGYNIGDADKTKLLDYVDSDMAVWNISNVMAINEKEFYGSYDDLESGESQFARFTKVPPSEVKDKKVLTLAMAYTDWGVRQEVIKFNKENDEYRISIQDYSTMYADEADYSAGVTRLNADIASGRAPDLLLLDESMPVESYMSKRLFEDLKPYIEKDEDLDINNFMPNIVEAFSEDGKLYILVPSFSINTLIAKTSDVGPERGWTVQEAVDLWDSKPEGTEFLDACTKTEIMGYCMRMANSQFINPKTGKCNFNSDEFIKMLEFINRFPDNLDENYYTDIDWEVHDAQWRTGKVLLSYGYISDFRDFHYSEKVTFGEDVTMIGFPSSDGDGSIIVPNNELAMSSKSAYKEGAWEFLRTFITDEYQSDLYGFTLSIKELEKRAEEATQKPYYEDENGNKVEYDDTVFIDGVEITIPPMTRQEADEFMEQLYSFKQISRNDNALSQIIDEEAAAYFAGQKSAKDVAGIIQSRAQVYVNETR